MPISKYQKIAKRKLKAKRVREKLEASQKRMAHARKIRQKRAESRNKAQEKRAVGRTTQALMKREERILDKMLGELTDETLQADRMRKRYKRQIRKKRKEIKEKHIQEKRENALGRARATKDQNSSIPSSWIDSIGYDPTTKTLIYYVGGIRYVEENVHPSDAKNFIEGNAACKTNDPTGRNRWRKGKTPSRGAAFHQYRIGKN